MNSEHDNSHGIIYDEALYRTSSEYVFEVIGDFLPKVLLFGLIYPILIFTCVMYDKRLIPYEERRWRCVKSFWNLFLCIFFSILVQKESEQLSKTIGEMKLRNTANEMKLQNASQLLLANTNTTHIMLDKYLSVLKVDTTKTGSVSNIVERTERLAEDMKEFGYALDTLHDKLISTRSDVLKDWVSMFDSVPTNPYVREDLNISLALAIVLIILACFVVLFAICLSYQQLLGFSLLGLLSLILCVLIFCITNNLVFAKFTDTCQLDEHKPVNTCSTGLWENITNMDSFLCNFNEEFGAITELTYHSNLDMNDLLNSVINLMSKNLDHQQKSFKEFSNQISIMFKTCDCSTLYCHFETLSRTFIPKFMAFVSGYMLGLSMLTFKVDWVPIELW